VIWLIVGIIILATGYAAVREAVRRFNKPKERILTADGVRQFEHKMGIGPFVGREKYCDLTKRCGHDYHVDIDKETQTGQASSRPTRFLMPAFDEAPVAESYELGQAPAESRLSVKEVAVKDLTVGQITAMVRGGCLSMDRARELILGPAPATKVDPNSVWWNGEWELERAAHLAQYGRIDGYCTRGTHEHNELRTMDGKVRRVCQHIRSRP
jgi:hypothetical protein